ncbi:uncharacterized protein FIBRA_01530 [Fibroporia radiculosa]|uniref:Carboxypeptidase n=1 Tax=Fibroporia radiculosa TaxID=599839 RepID=J4HTH2_9APHY|nr:uncharacterized protein FIBRA_01530 [Fibroporia radiculosa]CCL99512.1 predicted protein [Fibroporia radiculosa]
MASFSNQDCYLRDEKLSSDPHVEHDAITEDCKGGDNVPTVAQKSGLSQIAQQVHLPAKRHVRLPVEVWEKVIDILACEFPSYCDLWKYGVVCRDWYPRCQFHVRRSVPIGTKQHVYRLTKSMKVMRQRTSPMKHVTFLGLNITPLGPFAASMAHKLPEIEELTLRGSTWISGPLHENTFMYIHVTFRQITRLVLDSITLPNLTTLGRLIYSLPSLSSLSCCRLYLRTRKFVSGTVYPRPDFGLKLLALSHIGADILEFFYTILLASKVEQLALDNLVGSGSNLCAVLEKLMGMAQASLTHFTFSYFNGILSWEEHPLNLAVASKMRVITLMLGSDEFAKSSGWIAEFLSRAFPSTLHEVKIIIWRYLPSGAETEALLKALNSEENDYARVDQVLSEARYPAIKSVIFELDMRAKPSVETVSSDAWSEFISTRFPKLQTQGVIEAGVNEPYKWTDTPRRVVPIARSPLHSMLSQTLHSMGYLALLLSASLLRPILGVRAQAQDQYGQGQHVLQPAQKEFASQTLEDTKIRYVLDSGVCETTPGVSQMSGYVDIGANMSMWFWFFESRNQPETAPFTLWLNGGPGCSSMIALLQENGPCFVNPDNSTTYINPYSWNNISNMIYIDQPIGSGFSYGTIDVNSTFSAAPEIWKAFQILFESDEFEKYQSREFIFATESYGGHYGPGFVTYFDEQNAKITNGTIEGELINISALMINNGWFDPLIQNKAYVDFAKYAPGYGQLQNDTVIEQVTRAFYEPEGCQAQLIDCSKAGNSSESNTICKDADDYCLDKVLTPSLGDRNEYDLRQKAPGYFPPSYYERFLQDPVVMKRIGAEVEYQQCSDVVEAEFGKTGDDARSLLPELSVLANSGLKLLIWAGDADINCNWIGCHASVLAMDWYGNETLHNTPFVEMMIHGRTIGAIQNVDNFTFARIYEAGHEVPAFQPEASLEIFSQVIKMEPLHSVP